MLISSGKWRVGDWHALWWWRNESPAPARRLFSSRPSPISSFCLGAASNSFSIYEALNLLQQNSLNLLLLSSQLKKLGSQTPILLLPPLRVTYANSQTVTFTMSDRDVKTEEEHKNFQDEANDDEVREGPFRIFYPSRSDGGSHHEHQAKIWAASSEKKKRR